MSKTVTDSGSVPEVEMEIPEAGSAEYEHWRKSGQTELPEEEVREEQEEPTPAKGESATPSEAEKPKAATVPETVRPQKKTAEDRLKQLLAERKQERLSWEEEKRELLRRIPEPVGKVESATTKPEAKKEDATREPQPEDIDDKGQPKYKTWGDYTKARDKWAFEEAERRALAKVDERLKETEKARTESEAETQRKRVFTERSNVARKKYADFDAVAFNPEIPIPKGSTIESFILDSEFGTEIAYYLGQHPEEATRLTGFQYVGKNAKGEHTFQVVNQGLSERALIRELTLLELSLSPDPEEETVAPTTRTLKPAKPPVTAAPRPPRRVEGQTPSTRDEVEAAVEDEDQESYVRTMNARDLARRKSRAR